MGFRAVNWAYTHTLSVRDTYVLAAVCHRVNDATNQTWVSQGTIAEMLGLKTDDTVRLALQSLEGKGLLSRERRSDKKGWRSTDLITVHRTVPNPNPQASYPESNGVPTPKDSGVKDIDHSRTSSGNSDSVAGHLSDRQENNVRDCIRAVDEKTTLDILALGDDELSKLNSLSVSARKKRVRVWAGLRSRANTNDTADLGDDERLRGLLLAHGYSEEEIFAEMGFDK